MQLGGRQGRRAHADAAHGGVERRQLVATRLPPGLRIRIHFIRVRRFRLNTNPDPEPIRFRIRIKGFNDQKLKKKLQLKKIKFFFGSKTTSYLFLGLHKERPSYRRSLQLSKEAIQHFKT